MRKDRRYHRFKISNEAYAYLVIQRGEVSDHRHDRAAWEEAYSDSIAQIMQNITPALPPRAGAVVDIGGGLSGISVLIDAHYWEVEHVSPYFRIIDGLDDPPIAQRYPATFSNARVAMKFLADNGVLRAALGFVPPTTLKLTRPGQHADLIVSFASWCFHYPPETYLARVVEACHPDTIMILDMRNNGHAWLSQLLDYFDIIGTLWQTRKLTRYVFKPRMQRNELN